LPALQRLHCAAICALAGALAGCAAPTPHFTRAPPFATLPYDPFSRAAVVAIAQREWRLFGSPVDDDPPGTRPPPAPDEKPERMEGLWQRVGEYWYEGQPIGNIEAAWTGKHDAAGHVFPAAKDGDFAWSAAFVSYVMRMAAAGDSFPYSPNHSYYIDIARRMSQGLVSGYDLTAERVQSYAPQPGDVICMGRDTAAAISFDDLPAGTFPAHCDIVVDLPHSDPSLAVGSPVVSVIGGNVDDAVTLKHVPVTADGKLAQPDGTVVDPRYPWFVVLRMLYPR
jgi:hypothetical protein